ncbi:MAG: DegT/DnrJ/EryC1/StrS family aminotransferase [Deltaproteobacteria bacterium]|nr:DegT/DnrJ/EryC1/StrS family aminotransferase [Deltaproteobacteria bacterium]
MLVPYIDLHSQFKDPKLHQEIIDILKKCQFILGEAVDRFEKDFATLCGTRYALGLNSGTDALFLVLKALGIGQGDEVITVSNSFVATAGSIVAAGAKPVFVDVSPDYNMNPELIEVALTTNSKAVVPVHLTGNPADMQQICNIAKRNDLFVIEDAAQAVMASIGEKVVGSFGKAGCFSLHPLKNMNVAGDGGMITTDSKELYQKLKKLRNHGLKNRDEIEFFGYNSRLDTLQATIANHVLKTLESVIEKRKKNAAIYDKELSDLNNDVILPPKRKNIKQVYHTYVIQTKKREDLIRFLQEHDVETKIHYPIPIHLQKPCKELGYRKGDFPVCEEQAELILSLPVHQYLSNEQIHYVAKLINKFYR